MGTSDPAARIFLEDAERLGMTTREYEAEHGLVLYPRQREVEAHEVTAGDSPVLHGRSHHCRDCQGRAIVNAQEGTSEGT